MQYVFPAGGGNTPSGTQAQWVCWLVRTNSECGCTCGCDAVGCSGGGTPAVYYGNTGNVVGVGQLFGGAGGGGGSCGCGGGGGTGAGGNTFGPSPLNPTAAPSAPPPPSPYVAPPSAQGHQAQLRAVNLQLPVFTYNSMGPGSIELGSNWTMLYRQTINTPNSSTAVLTNGIGLSFTYTNKNASTGVYTAPPGAPNKLVQNADGTWTETAPDGSLLNYNTGGNLATLQRSRFAACGRAKPARLPNDDGLRRRWPRSRHRRFGPAENLGVNGTDQSFAQSRDGGVLVSAQSQGALIRRADQPDKVIKLEGHSDVRDVTVSPDGRWVATSRFSYPGGVRIWELKKSSGDIS